ncbi:MAG: hypothetical protein ABI316_05775 [Casimicrobiaceae bacterium]
MIRGTTERGRCSSRRTAHPLGVTARRVARALLMAIGFAPTVALAAPEFAVSGYGTLGYARSDDDLRYLRYIDNEGTIKADSLVGVQFEARFDPKWGATVQAVASAPRTRDSGYEAAVRWAFVSFRPQNDWLFRAGRLRPPVLINTQNAEVGVTYDQARLPVEVYSLSPVYDADGGAVTKTWALGEAELSLDGYWGLTKINYHLPFQRFDDRTYLPERITLMGLVLSYTSESLLLRAGIHRAVTRFTGDQPIEETFAPIQIPAPPPVGGDLYVPFNPLDRVHITVFTLGADWHMGDWRITGEYGQRIIRDTKIGPSSKGAYLTVARSIGKWTPYVTYARLLSGSEARTLYQTLNNTPVPLAALGPPRFLPTTYHAILADQIVAYDQYSTMLGASYSFSATSKIKVEWMRTHVGLVSALVDGDVHHKSFNVYSVSYSVAF